MNGYRLDMSTDQRAVQGGDVADASTAHLVESEYSRGQVLAAAAAQGAAFATVKAVIQRGGARAFERWTGEWPGD